MIVNYKLKLTISAELNGEAEQMRKMLSNERVLKTDSTAISSTMYILLK
jgi:hypothetical protein